MTGAKRTPSLQSGCNLQQDVLVERPASGDDLIVRSAGHGIDRLAECAQRALIRELDRHDHRDADGDAGDGQRGARLLAHDRTKD